ncbi:MAG TPA: adenylate/guanylate cyclase domain-containing protein [Acidimicrobiales bacterium]|nr:adenylate/guanylate cyclase domain-containing protein [Acidimicrobiales bacterium]
MDDAEIAYQCTAEGPLDLLFCYGFGSAIDLAWDEATTYPEFYRRLASFSRLILFDRRGTGASDPIPSGAFPTWESWAEDAGAVLDAAGSERAVLFGALDAGALAILFAAMHPERVQALIVLNSSARFRWSEDYPIGVAPEAVEMLIAMVGTSWGSHELAAAVNPAMADDDAFLDAVSRIMRAAATPRRAATQFRYLLNNLDVRPALHAVQVPTLVLNVAESPFVPLDHGRYIAEHISDARFVELPGAEIGLSAPLLGSVDEIEEFLTGESRAADVDRVLATVLFTDIVGSTKRAAELGDRPWRSLLDAHDRTVREQLRRFRGREVKTTGDGFLATFDGPARSIRCAQAIVNATRSLGVEVRAGLHTGECEVRGDDLGGLAVHIAARVGALAAPGAVLVSGTVKDLVVGSGIEFEDRGERELKGVPGSWRLFAVAP